MDHEADWTNEIRTGGSKCHAKEPTVIQRELDRQKEKTNEEPYANTFCAERVDIITTISPPFVGCCNTCPY